MNAGPERMYVIAGECPTAPPAPATDKIVGVVNLTYQASVTSAIALLKGTFAKTSSKVSVVEGQIASPPSIESTELSFTDTGCKLSNNSKKIVSGIASMKTLKDFLFSYVSYYTQLAQQGLSESKKKTYLKTLTAAVKKINKAYGRAFTSSSRLPIVTRLSCPKVNNCKINDYTKSTRSYQAELRSIYKTTLEVIAKNSSTFPKKANIAVNNKALKAAEKLYRKSVTDSPKFPTKSEICPFR